MPTYPLKITRVPSEMLEELGSLSAREMAVRIETYINENAKDLPAKIFDYADISHDLGIHVETVRRLLSSHGGGYNGIVIDNPDSDNEA